MNCNPDGTRLTEEQIRNMAASIGVDVEKIVVANHGALADSEFSFRTSKLRFEMMCKGQLILSTSESFVPKNMTEIQKQQKRAVAQLAKEVNIKERTWLH